MAGRTILHVDMDAFFVSVELRRRPELRGRPVVVGAAGARGVVAAASYEARRYGVHSAMPSVRAQRLCPQAVFLPGDHALYSAVSAEVLDIFRCVTPLVEGLSLDEAFLDVSGAMRLFGPASTIAATIRSRVRDELELGCSVGIAPSKFLAKLASEAAKPRATPQGITAGAGVVEVEPGGEERFLHPLPIRAMWGVGPKTHERLDRLGVARIGDLLTVGEAALVASLGVAQGRHLHQLARAIDPRPVEVDRAAKSIGHEQTYSTDLDDPAEIRSQITRLADGVAARLRHHGVGARTLTLKVRFAGFVTITRSTTVAEPLNTGPAIARAVMPLAAAIDPSPGVRLLGVSGANLAEPQQQLSFETIGSEQTDLAWTRASEAIDGIRERFGADAIGPAASMQRGRVATVRRGQQQWGPEGLRPSEEPA